MKGDTDTSNWNVNTQCSIAYSPEGTHFTAIGTGTNMITLSRNSSSHSFDGTKDTIFEFDFKQANACSIYLMDHTGTRRLLYTNNVYDAWQHWKLEYTASTQTVKVYIEDTLKDTVDLSSYTLTSIGLQVVDWNADVDAWIKELKVYQL